MAQHLLVLFVVMGAVTAAGFAVKKWSLRRAALAVSASGGATRPRLYYFWTPSCVSCRTVQRPVIDQLVGTDGTDVEIVSVNAQESPDDARRFGIWTVPTTVVVARDGSVRHVNTGPVDLATLRTQLSPDEPATHRN